MKSKLKGAQTGHDLLKRKSEALTKYVAASLRLCVPSSSASCFTSPYRTTANHHLLPQALPRNHTSHR